MKIDKINKAVVLASKLDLNFSLNYDSYSNNFYGKIESMYINSYWISDDKSLECIIDDIIEELEKRLKKEESLGLNYGKYINY